MAHLVGDTIVMKKGHPCGTNEWEILRTGADFKLRCNKCKHIIMIPRAKFIKNYKMTL